MNSIESATEQCLEWALRTNLTGDDPPDLRARILAAAQRGAAPCAAVRQAPRWGVPLTAAAGVVVAIGVAWLARHDAPAALVQEPAPRVVLADPWVVVADDVQLAALPADCAALRLGHWPAAVAGDGAAGGLAGVLARLPRLERLDLGRFGSGVPELTEHDVQAVARVSGLRELRLAGRREVTAGWLAHLTALPTLRVLIAPSCAFGDAGAAVVARLPSLEVVDLAFDHALGAEGVAALATIPGLRDVGLRACTGLDAEALAALGGLRRLERLDLDLCSGARLSRDDRLPPRMAATAEAMLVTELMAQGGRSGGVDATVLRALAGCERLRELRLLGCRAVTRAGLEHVAKLPLRRLSVSLPEQDAVRFVEGLPPTLEALSVAWSKRCDDAVLKAIATRLPLLRELDLMQCRAITDEGLAALLAALALRRLDLKGCTGLTAAALPHLLARASLEALDVSGAAWVDDAAVTALRAMPAMTQLEHRRGGALFPR